MRHPAVMRFSFPHSPAVLLFASVLSAVTVFAQPMQPLVREGVTEKISEHVHVIPDAGVSLVPNVGIVVGERGTFVIDTGLGARTGQTVVREAEKLQRNPTLYLATTHFHPEHDLGAMAFPA